MLINLKAHQLPKTPTHKLINFPTNQLTSSSIQKFTNSSTQKLINSKTHQLKSSSTQNLKLSSFILQLHSNFRSLLAKILAKKQVKCHYFYPFKPWDLSIFKHRTCILHHFAFLFCLPAHYFLPQITHFQTLKPYFLRLFCPFQPCISWL